MKELSLLTKLCGKEPTQKKKERKREKKKKAPTSVYCTSDGVILTHFYLNFIH